MQAWEKHCFGPVAAIRPYLFQKCFTLMVAFDLLVLMVERGSRYATDSIPFNVAHFTWLDVLHRWILPNGIPGEIYYVCVLTLTSFVAFCLFFGGHRPWLMAILCGLFTYGWAMSRLDSYLHHYLLSLIMFCMIFFPRIDAHDLQAWMSNSQSLPDSANRHSPAISALGGSLFVLAITYRISLSQILGLTDGQRWLSMCLFFVAVAGIVLWAMRSTREGEGPLTSAWSFRLLLTTTGVIYFFAAVAKMDVEWCGGHTLRAVGATETVLQPIVQLADSIGVSEGVFWAALATLVIPMELALAAIYVTSVAQDEPGRIWLRRDLLRWLAGRDGVTSE